MQTAQRLETARARLSELWAAPHAYAEIARIIRDLVPGEHHGLAYDLARDGSLGECGHTFDQDGRGWGPLGSVAARVSVHRQYSVEQPDAHANRTVTTEELFFRRDEELERVRALIWRPIDKHFQLRIAFYERNRFSALLALLRDRAGGDYSRADAELVDAIRSVLCDALRAARALGAVPADSTTLGSVLDSFEQPAFVVLQTGTIVYANVAARIAYPIRPGWLEAVVREPSRHAEVAAVTRIEHEGKSLYLLVPRDPPRTSFNEPPRLPPSLARLVTRGLSDKEVGELLRMPLSTVRTYVQRIYRMLRVRNRVELARAWRCEER